MRCTQILVVEDNDDIRETIVEALSTEGYRLLSAKNGLEALKRLAEPGADAEPTLILLDLMMPVMSGWEFLDEFKQRFPNRPHKVVTLSAVASTQSIEDPTPLETDGSLNKPISLDPLLEEVRKFCGMGEIIPAGSWKNPINSQGRISRAI